MFITQQYAKALKTIGNLKGNIFEFKDLSDLHFITPYMAMEDKVKSHIRTRQRDPHTQIKIIEAEEIKSFKMLLILF